MSGLDVLDLVVGALLVAVGTVLLVRSSLSRGARFLCVGLLATGVSQLGHRFDAVVIPSGWRGGSGIVWLVLAVAGFLFFLLALYQTRPRRR